MQLPIVAPAPLVTKHACAFRDLFANRKQYRHFENYLTGLMVLPNKSMANITRCILDSADRSNLSRSVHSAMVAGINQPTTYPLPEPTDKVYSQIKGRIGLVD